MSKSRPLRTILSLAFMAIAVPSMVNAQVAVENALSTDLNFRGQGRAGLCYAFSEEQLLKDFTCRTNCENNASEWKYSIFDIARAHQIYWVKQYNPIKADLSRDLFANGSSFVFPYDKVAVTSVRASRCTLEREIFFLNRSQITNPKRGDEPRDILADYLIRIYNEFKLGRATQPNIANADVLGAWNILKSLANESQNEFDFLAKVIDFTKCSDRLPLPKFNVQARDLADVGQITSLVESALNRGRSLYVGVCAEVLEKENSGDDPCGRHAVVLRRYNPVKKEILVIDSAFFSLRPRNTDGSSWIPASIVIEAIAKSGRDVQRILAETKKQMAEQSQSIDFAGLAKETTIGLKDAIVATKTTDVQKVTLQMLKGFANQYPNGSRENKTYRQVLAGAQKMVFNNVEDLEQLTPLFEGALKDLLIPSNSIEGITFNGIVWLEPKSQENKK